MTEKRVLVQEPKIIQPETGTENNMQLLTEDEQRSFKGCVEPQTLDQAEALHYLKILLKGDPETIVWYSENEKDEKRKIIANKKTLYQNDICSNAEVLSRAQNSDAYNLILQVIETKTEYPGVVACAVLAISRYGEFKEGKWYGDRRSIPVLEKILNDNEPEVRLQAAGTLLALGRADIALPVLEKFAKSGIKESVEVFKKLFQPEEIEINGRKRIVLSKTRMWDEKGKDIIINALDYPWDEVNALAALILVNMQAEQQSAETTAINILKRLKNMNIRDYKKAEVWESDRNAGLLSIAVLEKGKTRKGISFLKDFTENNDDVVLKKNAELALKKMQQ